jgi:hypothetical protein
MRFVITSVNYADFLEVTLPLWKAFLPPGTLYVATSHEDVATRVLTLQHGVGLVVTDAWTRRDASCHEGGEPTFNLALGLDESLGLASDLMPPPSAGEIVGHVSADCAPFGRWPDESRFDAQTIYGFWRYECLTQAHLNEHWLGRRPLAKFPRLKNTKGAPIGYNQIFRAKPGRRFGSYPTAGKFDTHFTTRFPRFEMLLDAYLLHLGPINVRENWAGRTVPTWGTA